MMLLPAAMGLIGGRYITTAVDYNGSSHYRKKAANLDSADTKFFTFSVWIRPDALNVGKNTLIHAPGGNPCEIYLSRSTATTGTITVALVNAASASVFNSFASTAITLVNGSQHHLYAYGDSSQVNGAAMYWDGTLLATSADNPGTNRLIDWTRNPWTVGASNAPAAYYSGCMSELYLNTVASLGASGLASFRVAGKPISLGASGQLPSGSQPAVYSPGGDPGVENLGYAGLFNSAGSTPGACSSSPTD